MSKFRNAFEPVAARVRTKCMKSLEHLFKVQPSEVLESLIECWLLSTTSQSVSSLSIPICEGVESRFVDPGFQNQFHKRN